MFSASPESIATYLEKVANKVMDASEVCRSYDDGAKPKLDQIDTMLDELKEAGAEMYEQIFYLGQFREKVRAELHPEKKKKRVKKKGHA